jgi:hypothetical protein
MQQPGGGEIALVMKQGGEVVEARRVLRMLRP